MSNFTRRSLLAGTTLALTKKVLAGPQDGVGSVSSARHLDGLDMSPDAVLARRKEALEILQKAYGPTTERIRGGRLNAIDKNWEEWLQRTGALPPDFAAMPGHAFLPDPLLMDPHGRRIRVQTREQWRPQREWIKKQCEEYLLGTMPPPPGNVRVQTSAEHREGDALVRDVVLEFGPDQKGTLRVQVIIPPGRGPFPVLMTNHPRMRPWVNTAVRRGWIGCIESAADTAYIRVDDSDKWIELYPDYNWGAVMRWAWGAMRALDYLLTLPMVDAGKIVIGGHSRNSKSTLVAGAFDERFAGVIPSRGNSGDGNAWRLTSAVYMNESLEELTAGMPHWFHPGLRFFVGREHKLPVDTNMLMSLVAPRALVLSHAFTEHQGSALAIEQAYRSVRSVYKVLGAEHKLALYQQPGEHASSAEDVEQYFDHMETVFGRKRFPRPEIWVHGYSFEKWQRLSGETVNPVRYPVRKTGDYRLKSGGQPIESVEDWQERRKQIQQQIRWALGEEPPAIPYHPERTTLFQGGMTSDGWLGQLLPRQISGMRAFSFAFGDDLKSEMYIPEAMIQAFSRTRSTQGAPGQPSPPAPPPKFPVVLWLHPYSYAMGYCRYSFWYPLVEQGFIVLTFDQIGFGSRNLAALRFYERYPKWSLLGKMVADTRAAVENLSRISTFDASRIYLCGQALGAKVALFTAALEDRVAGVAASCGFFPLRQDKPEKGTEGVRHYSHLHGLMPRLGYFAGHEQRLPIDYDEILAAVAPKPVYIQAATLDRFNPFDDVKEAVEHAQHTYRVLGKESALEFEARADFNQINVGQQKTMFQWLSRNAGLGELIEKKPEKQ